MPKKRAKLLATAASLSGVTERAFNPDDEELLPNEAAATFLGLAPGTLLTWRSRDRGPAYYKIGRLAYYRISDLKTWREKQRREPMAA